jgi:hypothetical protein
MGIVAKFDTLRTLAFGGISGTYATVGVVLANPANAFRLINGTNGDILFSVDGTNDNFFVPASSFVLYDIAANKTIPGNSLQVAAQTQFYAKQSTAPTSGAVYIEIVHQN